MTLKLKVGKKGYIILPKAIRESVGIEEGDNLSVEVGDGITLRPEKKTNINMLKKALHRHAEHLKTLPNITSPIPGELECVILEEEFEG